jgi:lysophospholipase L1-like esterase
MWRSLVVAMLAAASGVRAAQTTGMKFLALGDSYTIGERVAAHERWPDQLVAALRTHGIDIADAEIVARTGWTTDELSSAMDAHAFHPPYALVTLLIGVNNQYRGRDVENYRSEFRLLLERAVALAGDVPGHVVVVSIPDWGVTRFGRESGRDGARIARELDAYNAANAQIATMQHVRYADVTGASRDGGERADMLVSDGLHPSAAMYARWLDAILPAARLALEETGR